MSFIERMPFLSQNDFFFKAERVKKSEKKEKTSRIKIFLKDLSTLVNLAYFDSRKDYAPKLKSTFRTLDTKPLLYILKPKAIQKRLRFWIFSLDENTEAEGDLNDSSPSFIGELVRAGKIPANRFTFTLRDGTSVFSIKPNLTGTTFVFENLKSEGPNILAEGDRKLLTTWGWDYEFSIKFHENCDNYTRALLICCIRAVAPTFYPS